MARLVFTENLKRHIDCPPMEVKALTLEDALQALVQNNPKLANYVLDEQGNVRKHILISINNEFVKERSDFSREIDNDTEIYIFQALSGG